MKGESQMSKVHNVRNVKSVSWRIRPSDLRPSDHLYLSERISDPDDHRQVIPEIKGPAQRYPF